MTFFCVGRAQQIRKYRQFVVCVKNASREVKVKQTELPVLQR